ncbi:hypothetical protein FL859_07230 [Listeria monocytogenes]|nr:hypothetical protein [Listeria monocytogenes]
MTWVASNLSTAANCEIKLAPLPRRKTGQNSISVMLFQMLSVAKNSKFKAEAAKFISFFQKDIEANRILKAERSVPIMQNVRDDLAKNGDVTTQILFDYAELVNSLDDGKGNVIESPVNAPIEDEYRLLVERYSWEICHPKMPQKKFIKWQKINWLA